MRALKSCLSFALVAIFAAAPRVSAHHIHPDPNAMPFLARLFDTGDHDDATDDAVLPEEQAPADPTPVPADPMPPPEPTPVLYPTPLPAALAGETIGYLASAPVDAPPVRDPTPLPAASGVTLAYLEPAPRSGPIDLVFHPPSYGSSLLMMPVAVGQLTSDFGMRRHPVTGTWKQHDGIDWSAPPGTPVFASADGVVIYAGWEGGYGNVVRIAHPMGKETTYAHLSAMRVAPGDIVRQGQTIGTVGSTGNATGPHLHYEVRINGTLVNPLAPQVLQARAVFTEEVTLREITYVVP